MSPVNLVTFDAESLVRVWVRAVPGLVGPSSPLIGVHLVDDARSPQRGAIASLRVGSPRTVDLLGDHAVINWEVKAGGAETGSKAGAHAGAVALAAALRGVEESGPVLVTDRGVTGQLWVDEVTGPTWVGAPGGQATYRVDSQVTILTA